MVKRLAIILTLLSTPALLSSPALAQTAPTVEQVQEQANGLIAALQSQRNDCQDRSAQTLANAQTQIAKLQKEIAELRKSAEPKKD